MTSAMGKELRRRLGEAIAAALERGLRARRILLEREAQRREISPHALEADGDAVDRGHRHRELARELLLPGNQVAQGHLLQAARLREQALPRALEPRALEVLGAHRPPVAASVQAGRPPSSRASMPEVSVGVLVRFGAESRRFVIRPWLSMVGVTVMVSLLKVTEVPL